MLCGLPCPQFTDKLENMLENLTVTAEQVKNAEPISAHPDKIRDQLVETRVSDRRWFTQITNSCTENDHPE
jgi:transposase